jgi:hypothetical protein
MNARRNDPIDDDEMAALEEFLQANLTPFSPPPAFVRALDSRLQTGSPSEIRLEPYYFPTSIALVIILATLVSIPVIVLGGRRGVQALAAALRQRRMVPAI